MTHIEYSQRLKKLLSKLDNPSAVLIVGNGMVSRSADTTFSFRQDSNLLYTSGLQNPGICLLVDCIHAKTYIVKPNTSAIEKIFDDPFIPDASQGHIGYESIIPDSQAIKILKDLSIKGTVYMNMPPQRMNSGIYANPHRQAWYNRLRSNRITNIKDIRPSLAQLRMIKSASEIEAITTAATVTKKAMDVLYAQITATTTEKDLEYMFTGYFASHAMQHAYLPIVASGANAAILHHMPTAGIINKDTCLLLDIGAEHKSYAADISRTYTIGTNVRVQTLIEAVSAVQAELIACIAPGVTMQELQTKAMQLLQKVAKQNKLDGDIKKLFPHSIGHHLGLDVHDAADYTQPLAKNMVITIEPGLYSKQLGIGVRIEDDILVTNSGSKLL